MNSRILPGLVLVTVLALSATAAAQTFSITVSGPESALQVQSGQSTTASVDVTLQGDEFGCAQETELPVTITVTANRLTPSASPAELTYTVPAGVHSSATPATMPYNQTQPTSVQIQAPANTAAFSGQVTVTATFPGGDFTPASEGSCGPGSFPSAEGSTTLDVSVQGAPTDGGDGSDGGDDDGGDGGVPPTNGNQTNGDDEDDNGIPVGPWLAPVAIVGAALLAARRHE